jgi:phage antirepressor YoqD-like protein
MPTPKKTVIEVTEEELDRWLKDAAAAGAEQATEQLRKQIADLDRAARVEAGLITLRDICEMYDVTPNTVRNWGITPIDSPTQKNLYRVSEIEAQIAE